MSRKRSRTVALFLFTLALTAFVGPAVAEESERKLRRQTKNQPSQHAPSQSQSSIESDFLNWCLHQGIETPLQIQTFEYYDYLAAMKDRVDVFCEDCYLYDDDSFFDHPDQTLSVADFPTVKVRGLAAATDIKEGTLLIRIPHQALWTLDIIDKDPRISGVLGEEARIKHGWNEAVDEIPLLCIALLYHLTLGEESPYLPYLNLLHDTDTEQYPHLWTPRKLRTWAPLGVRSVAKAIQKDVEDLYRSIMLPLISENPDMFGPPPTDLSPEAGEDDDVRQDRDGIDDNIDDEVEWMFSLERFRWAFALINSRHWYLRLPESVSRNITESSPPNTDQASMDDDGLESRKLAALASPPASMPTEDWLVVQRNAKQREDDESQDRVDPILDSSADNNGFRAAGNSFLAPLADLLNFGPPCTRGYYNDTTKTFDIVATCDFREGQEVTFWYGDACQDVYVANYGFTLPMMVPTCTDSAHSVLTQRYQENLEDLIRLDEDLDLALQALEDCDCAPYKGKVQMVAPPTPAPSPPSLPPSASYQHARHAIRGAQEPGFQDKQQNMADGLTRGFRRSYREDSRKSDL